MKTFLLYMNSKMWIILTFFFLIRSNKCEDTYKADENDSCLIKVQNTKINMSCFVCRVPFGGLAQHREEEGLSFKTVQFSIVISLLTQTISKLRATTSKNFSLSQRQLSPFKLYQIVRKQKPIIFYTLVQKGQYSKKAVKIQSSKGSKYGFSKILVHF